MFGKKSNFAGFYCAYSGRGKRFCFHEPLFLNLGFNDRAAFVACSHGVAVRVIGPNEKPFRVHFCDNFRACLIYFHSCEFARDRKQLPALVDYLLFFKIVPLGDFKVGRGVPRSNRHNAGAEFHINVFVLDNRRRDCAVYPFQLDFFSVFVFRVPFVIRMHDNIFIAEFCLGSGCRYYKGTILEIVEGVVSFNILDF